MKKVGRNDPCPCGSGKKFKKCCESKMIGKRFMATKIENSDVPKKSKNLSSLFQKTFEKPTEEKIEKDLKSHSVNIKSKDEKKEIIQDRSDDKSLEEKNEKIEENLPDQDKNS